MKKLFMVISITVIALALFANASGNMFAYESSDTDTLKDVVWDESKISEMSGVQFLDGKLYLTAPNLNVLAEQSNLTSISGCEEIGAFYNHNGNIWAGSAKPARVYYSLNGWDWVASDEVPNSSSDTRVYGITTMGDSILFAAGTKGANSFVVRSFDALNYGDAVTWDSVGFDLNDGSIKMLASSGSRLFAVTAPNDVRYSARNDGKVYMSDDYGASFTGVSFGGNAIYDIVVWGPGSLVVVGDTIVQIGSNYVPQPLIAYTTDNGDTWKTYVFGTLGSDFFCFGANKADDTTLVVGTYPEKIWGITNPFSSPSASERDTLDVISDPDTTDASDIIVTRILNYKGSLYLLEYSQDSNGNIEYTKVLKSDDGGYTLEQVDSIGGVRAMAINNDKRGFVYIGTTTGTSGKPYFYGYNPEGYFVTNPIEIGYNNVMWGKIFWDGENTDNRFYYATVKVRTSPSADMSDATDWDDIDASDSGSELTEPGVYDGDKYVQYMVYYNTKKTYISPVINSVEITYVNGINDVRVSDNITLKAIVKDGASLFYLNGITGRFDLDIYNIVGRRVSSVSGISNGSSRINVDISNGVYIYKLSTNGKVYTGKIVILK